MTRRQRKGWIVLGIGLFGFVVVCWGFVLATASGLAGMAGGCGSSCEEERREHEQTARYMEDGGAVGGAVLTLIGLGFIFGGKGRRGDQPTG